MKSRTSSFKHMFSVIIKITIAVLFMAANDLDEEKLANIFGDSRLERLSKRYY